ncbi:hypothetical protein BHE74_00029264 [Ensete ventricosum]|uniref:Uncharacterized protein n=1 Tax=Ensete ventricosum TaxID=4639 RepID=A0A427A1Y0_ENSVE|nr:hypothetical protein B296_00029784 [Ensete ventricosum]RWW09069.1 hypothetical protein GW17_00027458 [Ensete ventricosum]RWW63549.1 hypothetical protein BHE74_00029264 [Ensete ventricosum]RZS02568.1 hypothetical protein BHM03_00032634 [Ensete ventricosum]
MHLCCWKSKSVVLGRARLVRRSGRRKKGGIGVRGKVGSVVTFTLKPMALEQVFSDRDSEDEVDDDIADFEDRRVRYCHYLPFDPFSVNKGRKRSKVLECLIV